MKNISYKNIGLKGYQEAWDFQKELHEKVLNSRASENDSINKNNSINFLVLCEHPHVYTLGKSGSINNLLVNNEFLKEKGATFFNTDRGGDITYHGPGQIVGYPIIDLNYFGIGVKEYVHKIEESIILTLKEYKISTERLEGATGVWIDSQTKKARKICAIGVKVSRGITMHGFALNVNTDLSFFNLINPCGFTDKTVTSMEKEFCRKIDFEEVKQHYIKNFAKVFDVKVN
ncbi:MAG TPA: lipoyl(octanoyl) transferase LipB [Bacteroidales bacterium]|nr:lipoyl(octanoyl) transferase LipB [Bacteroidales bacterium]HPS16216.1 lipoyl(octanoyl) transferase LipB [Bacteroidales bacterium]